MKRRPDSERRDISPPPPAKRPAARSAALSSFFTPLPQKKVSETTVEWQVRDGTLLVGRYRAKDYPSAPTKIAAFDLDGTLVKTKSGLRFANDAGDWTWLYSKIPTKLKELYSQGHAIVIFSNQSRLSFEPKAKLLPQWKQKLQAMAETLDLPLVVLAATSKEDVFRKPRIGMWNMYAKEAGITSREGLEMFFVGDAGGRIAAHATSRAKDFADTDRKFAMNLNIPFHTPEEFFLGDKPTKFLMGAFNPRDYIPSTRLSMSPGKNNLTVTSVVAPSSTPDILLFVGSPASGKSTFFAEQLQPAGYVRINQDTLKTRDRCVAEATTLLNEDKRIAVVTNVGDNTNADKATRKIWIDLAKKFNRSIRCVHFTATPQLARHNNLVRALGGYAKEDRRLLPMSAIYMFAQRFQEPTLDEGFTEIIKVDFQFKGTLQEQEIWSMWWD